MKILSAQLKNALSCPICQSSVECDGKALYCLGQKRHSYDISSSGYVNFAMPSQSGGGDSKDAVKARSAFLDTDMYKPICDMLCQKLKKYLSQSALVIDAGCGEGYYSNAVAQCGFDVIGFDISKFAAEFGAKRAKRQSTDAFFAVASVFSMPLANACSDAVINIFAPCAEAEYSRVLRSGGILVVVHAGPRHLLGLKKAIYTDAYKNDARADLPTSLELIESDELSFEITINGGDNIKNLFAMTPYYWKTSVADFEKLSALEELATEIDICFSVYRKN